MSAGPARRCWGEPRQHHSIIRIWTFHTNLSVLCRASSPSGTVPHSWRNARCWRPCPTMTFCGVSDLSHGCPIGTRLFGGGGSVPRGSGVRLGRRSRVSDCCSLQCSSLSLSHRVCVLACVRARARISPRPICSRVLRRCRPRCGSDCDSESGCHGVGGGGAVRCSPVGCDLMMGQHLLPLPAAPAACVSAQSMWADTSGGPFQNKRPVRSPTGLLQCLLGGCQGSNWKRKMYYRSLISSSLAVAYYKVELYSLWLALDLLEHQLYNEKHHNQNVSVSVCRDKQCDSL